MGYLEPGEYAAFGLTAETADGWVVAASAMIEAHCRRPSLMAQAYVERLRVGKASHAVRLSYGPVVSVSGVRARFGGTHISEPTWGAPALLAGLLEAEASVFCLPGTWAAVDVSTIEVDAVLGEVRLPWNVLGARYAEAEVTYTAGFVDVPPAVKVACAQIVKNAQATPGLNVRQSRVDTLQMQYFSDSLLDSQVQALLRPYVAERLS